MARERSGALAALAGVAVLSIWLAKQAHIALWPAGARGLVRTGVVACAFFGVCGYGPARLLIGARAGLYTLPVGAACGTLALTLLGLLHVPLTVSLAVVLVAFAALAVVVFRRGPRTRPRASALTLAPLAVGVLIAAVACLPSIRTGFPAVQGQNGDAVLAVGTADFLQHAPPTAVRPDLALDRVPLLWRSKLPIYYGLAAVSRLAGQDTIVAFTGMAAVMVALAALGFFLLARDGLRAPPVVALAVMSIVGFERIVVHIVYGPFYNQLWALFSLPFALLFGWRFLQDPSRRNAGLAALFIALALFTYPLLLPFPAVFLGVIAWLRRRERWWGEIRLPRVRSAAVRYAVLALLAVPVTLVLVRGIVEKVLPAARALAPGGDLTGWSGLGILPYLPFGWFFGVSARPLITAVVVGAVLIAAVLGLRRVPRDGAIALGILLAGALLSALYLKARGSGELFYFKDLGFAGPLVVTLAVVGLAALRPRVVAVAAVALFAVIAAESAGDEVSTTFEQTPATLLELRTWDRQIPTDETIRIDVPRSGWQLWSWYLMPRHKLSVLVPLGGYVYPHPPAGTKADLALVFKPTGTRPTDAVGGPPLRENDGFALYRLRPDLPGLDISSKRLVYDTTKITY
jgi:hypothetical protein